MCFQSDTAQYTTFSSDESSKKLAGSFSKLFPNFLFVGRLPASSASGLSGGVGEFCPPLIEGQTSN